MKELILQYNSGSIKAMLGRGEKTLVQGVSFALYSGESMALIGETGSGKTMTALSIMRLLPPNVTMSGESITFLGSALPSERQMRRILGRDIVYIPQSGLEFLDPSKKVKHQLYDNLKRIGVERSKLKAEAEARLLTVGFGKPEEVMEKYPFQLSGGMAQRVTIAIAACSKAKLVIADEPTNGLDQAGKNLFMALLYSLFPDAARLVITHDITVAALCEDAAVLCGGKMMEKGNASNLLGFPHSPYTQALMAALPENGMKETPALRSGKSACPFYTRCEKANERCADEFGRRVSGSSEWWCRE